MKNNTETSKQALSQALRNLPSDEVLSEVRYHIRVAINKLEHVEKKRAKRQISQTSHDKWQESLASGREALTAGVNSQQAYDMKRSINAIDQLIKAEQRKLDQIAQERQKKPQPQQDIEPDDGDDLSTIYG